MGVVERKIERFLCVVMATRRVANTDAGVQDLAGRSSASHPRVVSGGSAQPLLADIPHELGTVAGRRHAFVRNDCLI